MAAWLAAAAAAAAVAGRGRGCWRGLPAARCFSFYTHDAADILLRGMYGQLSNSKQFSCAAWQCSREGARSHSRPLFQRPLAHTLRLMHRCLHPCLPLYPAEYQLGRPAQVVPFEITEQQARQKFLDWQRGAARLAPGGLLPLGGRWNLRAALLPFWLFEVQARVEYAGSVGSAEK